MLFPRISVAFESGEIFPKWLPVECDTVSGEGIFVQANKIPPGILDMYFQGILRRMGGKHPPETGAGSTPVTLTYAGEVESVRYPAKAEAFSLPAGTCKKMPRQAFGGHCFPFPAGARLIFSAAACILFLYR